MQQYAQKNGYTLVLDAGQQQSPILWASEATNISEAIVQAYNAQSGVPPQPNATAAPKTGGTTTHTPAATPRTPAATPHTQHLLLPLVIEGSEALTRSKGYGSASAEIRRSRYLVDVENSVDRARAPPAFQSRAGRGDSIPRGCAVLSYYLSAA